MLRRSLAKSVGVFLVTAAILSGCSDNGGTSQFSPAAPGASSASGSQPVQTNSVIIARVHVGTDVANATVTLQDSSGNGLGSGTTNADGMVFFNNISTPANFRAVATLPGSSQQFACEVVGFSNNNKQARISLLTTLASQYLASHPGMSLEDAENRIKLAVNLPSVIDTKIGPDDPNPGFSDIALLRAAGAAGGWAVYSQKLLANAETGQGTSFLLSRDQLDRPITGLEDGLSSLAG